MNHILTCSQLSQFFYVFILISVHNSYKNNAMFTYVLFTGHIAWPYNFLLLTFCDSKSDNNKVQKQIKTLFGNRNNTSNLWT